MSDTIYIISLYKAKQGNLIILQKVLSEVYLSEITLHTLDFNFKPNDATVWIGVALVCM